MVSLIQEMKRFMIRVTVKLSETIHYVFNMVLMAACHGIISVSPSFCKESESVING